MIKKISVIDYCGEFCIDENDVKVLIKKIVPEISKKSVIELDFRNVDTVLTAFLSSLIGELMKNFKLKIIENAITFHTNTNRSVIDKYERALESAKKFTNSSKQKRENIRKKINMIFNEVDLNESYSYPTS